MKATGCPPDPLLFVGVSCVAFGTWCEQIPSKVTTESLMRRFDHHFVEGDPEGAQIAYDVAENISAHVRTANTGGRSMIVRSAW